MPPPCFTPVTMAPCFPSQDAQLPTDNGSTTFVPTERILLASMMTLDDTDEILHVIHKSLRFECACLVIASSPVKYCPSGIQKCCFVFSKLSSWTIASIKNSHILTKTHPVYTSTPNLSCLSAPKTHPLIHYTNHQ